MTDPAELVKRVADAIRSESIDQPGVEDFERMACAAIAVQQGLRAAAEHVVWFDWSDNDSDAVAAIEQLRNALEQ